jgi:hypothetical protein
MRNKWMIGIALGFLVVITVLVLGILQINRTIERTADEAIRPITDFQKGVGTQIAGVLHPTPTILPDPITIVHDIRSLARLETIQFTLEKVITAEEGQGTLPGLFGDKLLFVAHGEIIAGVDLAKIHPDDIRVEGKILYIRLPDAEIFVSRLDNEKSYVYDRQTGLLTHGDTNLETEVRRTAEDELRKSALSDGILDQARVNAENYLSRLLRGLGYPEVVFEESVGP